MATKRTRNSFARHSQAGRSGLMVVAGANPKLEASEVETLLTGWAIPSLTPHTGKKLFAKFGAAALDEIEHSDPEAVTLLGKNFEKVWNEWETRKKHASIMAWLLSKGLGGTMANRVCSWLDNESTAPPAKIAQLWKEDPYRLTMVPGIGFARADDFALDGCSVPLDSPLRKAAIAREALRTCCENVGGGAEPSAAERVAVMLSAGRQRLSGKEALSAGAAAIRYALETGIAVQETDSSGVPCLFSNELFANEELIAEALLTRLKGQFPPLPANPENTREASEFLNPGQLSAIDLVARSGTSIVCGRPGSGKTTMLKFVAPLLETSGPVFYAAPTGMAAKRMSKSLGRPASTIHRLLHAAASGQADLSSAAAVVIDEMSMIDAALFSKLLAALGPSTRLILLGDPDQLPSIGAGNVLKNMIDSRTIPTATLTQVMRQKDQSNISSVANEFANGTVPLFDDKSKDCVFLQEHDPELAVHRIGKIILDSAAKKYDIRTEVQVLCAGKAGALGSERLNASLQQLLNPPTPDGKQLALYGDSVVRVGDKVMHKSNDYERAVSEQPHGPSRSKGVFNGQMGVVQEIAFDAGGLTVTVKTDDGFVDYNERDAKKYLSLAWATTIHKFQGSEAPVVFLMAHESSAPQTLRSRNLFYTGLTRARSKCVVVGHRSVLEQSAARCALANRKTRLRGLLDGSLSFKKPIPDDVLAFSEDMAISRMLSADFDASSMLGSGAEGFGSSTRPEVSSGSPCRL